MKKFIILTILFSAINSFSQKAKIIYTASIDMGLYKHLENKKDVNQDLVKNVNKDTKDVKCELLINKNQSLFRKIKQLNIEKFKFNLTDLRVGESTYYYDNSITIEKNETFGKTFLITKDKIKWTLINETKKINDFECKKAITIIKVAYSDGIKDQKIIAWYTPQIPLNFGPKNYNGLPGLVLILQDKDLTYSATKIILNSDEKIIINRPKGKKITQKEFDKIFI